MGSSHYVGVWNCPFRGQYLQYTSKMRASSVAQFSAKLQAIKATVPNGTSVSHAQAATTVMRQQVGVNIDAFFALQ